MTPNGPSAMVVIAGDDVYEDLFGAAAALQQIVLEQGLACSQQMGMGRFADQPGGSGIGVDLVVLYTAAGEFSSRQQNGLAAAVEQGMGLLAVHASNVLTATPGHRVAVELIGSRYASHGPRPHESRFTVESTDHELTQAVNPFQITHEHYELDLSPEVEVIAWRQAAESRVPLVHVRRYGRGRVCYLQLGHDMRTWDEPSVRTIIGRAVIWARRKEPAA